MNPRILIIEDNEQNRYLAAFLLRQHGLEILFAHTGSEGVVMARAERPNLILMDIQMPEMDGYEAARQIFAQPETRAIPVVAVTSYAMVGDREKAMSMGFTDYIEKPFDPETFAGRILRHLRLPEKPS
jgi:CheY-like chemotaxis protein